MSEVIMALRKLAAGVGPVPTLVGKCANVSVGTSEVILDVEGVSVPVRMKVIKTGGRALTLCPKINTACIAVRIEEDEEWLLLSADEWEYWQAQVAMTEFRQDSDGFLLKKGEDSLGPLMADLIEQILLIYAPKDSAALVALKTKFESILK
jgi:hypothetical protein